MNASTADLANRFDRAQRSEEWRARWRQVFSRLETLELERAHQSAEIARLASELAEVHLQLRILTGDAIICQICSHEKTRCTCAQAGDHEVHPC